MASLQIDVDELAREKVREIEKLLDSPEGVKLELVNSWLSVLKKIITAADLHRTNDKNGNYDGDDKQKKDTDESIYADYSDDNEQFNAIDLTEQFASNSVKWTIRVQAFKIVHRLVHIFNKNSPPLKILLLKHLPDLVRLSFIAATSPYDDLKLQGFDMFKFLINRFAYVEEREFPGQSILEQYRTQVISALKPAFNLDAPPYITAIASQVCCLWICRGLEKESVNLNRAYQLMTLTIVKLEHQGVNQNSALYTESELEQERLDILGSWAQLYIISNDSSDLISNKSTDLTKFDYRLLQRLVERDVSSLISKWWEALKDYALLIMPSNKLVGVNHDNEHVYTRDVALRLFEPLWYKLTLASTIWLCSNRTENQRHQTGKQPDVHSDGSGEPNDNKEGNECQLKNNCDIFNKLDDKKTTSKYLNFICGLLMKELCRCHAEKSQQKDHLPDSTLFTLRSLSILVNNPKMKLVFTHDKAIGLEFYSILYSILINYPSLKTQNQAQLRTLSDTIFKLEVTNLTDKDSFSKHGLAYLIQSTLENLMNDDDTAQNSSKLKAQIDIPIRLFHILSIINLKPSSVTDHHSLIEGIIQVFKLILASKLDISLSISLLECLHDLQGGGHSTVEILNELFEVQVEYMTNIFRTLINSYDKVDSTQSYSSIEFFKKSILSSICVNDEVNRTKMINIYLKNLVSVLSRSSVKDESYSSASKDTVAILDCIRDLESRYPEEFKFVLLVEQKLIIDEAKRLESCVKKEIKQTNPASKKLTTSNLTKPQHKITLKADFSNFYAKKS